MISKTTRHLAKQFRKNQHALDAWFHSHFQDAPPPFYCSIDLRDSGDKVVPVDSNLFPAGFNNICPEDLRNAPLIFRRQLSFLMSRRCFSKEIQKILILPESHTQNLYYLENLYYLCQLIEAAGYEVRIGWYGDLPSGAKDFLNLTSFTGKSLKVYPIRVVEGIVEIEGFRPDCVLLNNDFSIGYPALLDLVKQPILPSHTLGWHSRKKSEHFAFYNQLASEFAKIAEIDPWIIQIDTKEISPVNFQEEKGAEEVAKAVEQMLHRTRQAYIDHHIDRKPFVFVKNNAGTYGMGVMVAYSAEDLRHMNRRTKNKMSVGKNHMPIESVVVQEGVPTVTLVDRLAAEPVIYLFGSELIGGFLRTHPQRGTEDNLNTQGMVFRKLCMSDLRDSEQNEDQAEGSEESRRGPVRELVYGSIAKISALASGMEQAKHAREYN